MRRVVRPTARGDRGAAALIVALVVSAFMIGLGALVTDVGSWYAERAQVQNGADAGALAVAQTCAAGNCILNAAASYAPANNNGTLNTSSAVTTGFPCGNAPGSPTALPACPAGTEDGTYCPTAPASGTPYVNVHVDTSNVAPILGKALDKTDTGKTILACAQARWGPPSSLGNSVALTISACEWSKNTNNGTTFASVPANGSYAAGPPYFTSPPSYLDTLNTRRNDNGYDATPNAIATNFYRTSSITDPHSPVVNAQVAGSETVITTHGFGNTCDAGNPGWAVPGQFGWLSSSNCSVPINGNTYGGSTGNVGAEPPCGPIFLNSLQTKTPIFMPVYTTVTGTGSNAVYTLDGFAAFVVTGWDVGGGQNQWGGVTTRTDSVITQVDTGLSQGARNADAHYCGASFTGSSSDVCIYGYFTKALIPASDLPNGGNGGGGNNLGATNPYLSG
jgi:Flp pilus assembly protein TadG